MPRNHSLSSSYSKASFFYDSVISSHQTTNEFGKSVKKGGEKKKETL